jgi:peptide chain release factor
MRIHISSGNSIDEVCRALWHFLHWLQEEYDFEIVQTEKAACKNAYRSLVLESNDRKFKALEGTLLWKCRSPFRPKHKRRNWYFSLLIYDSDDKIYFDETQIRYQTMKSPKKGGQHVNTTDSGVRALYPPLRIEVMSCDERSQHRNREIAKRRLLDKIEAMNNSRKQRYQNTVWRIGKQVERGNAVKVFEGSSFREVC